MCAEEGGRGCRVHHRTTRASFLSGVWWPCGVRAVTVQLDLLLFVSTIMYAAHPHTARRDGSREHCYLSVSTIMNHPIMQTFEHWSLPMAWAEGSERPPLRRLPNRPPLGSEQELETTAAPRHGLPSRAEEDATLTRAAHASSSCGVPDQVIVGIDHAARLVQETPELERSAFGLVPREAPWFFCRRGTREGA